ncbi:MAG: endonuclease/exonuclease/phosphatase family protein [Bacteroidales bacterium]|nr:endonuclease/exonuclease/phosphatase family protein [Bacteroidales bacterium]
MKLLLAINLVTLIALLFSYLSYHTSPAEIFLPVIFGITYPIWFLLNFLFILLWLFLKKWWLVFSLVAIVLGWSHVSTVYQSGDKQDSPGDGLQLMSYNVRFFDVYNSKKDTTHDSHHKIYRFLEEQKADILCFQEFYNEDTPDFAVMDSLLAIQPAKNYHIDYFKTRHKYYHWGLATFSKYPIINRQRHQFRNSFGNYFIYTDIVYGRDTMRVFNVHLESWHFEQEDYHFISNFSDSTQQEQPIKAGLKNIYWKMRSASMKRAVQVKELQNIITSSPYPVLVCGDFNSPPVSFVYNQMTTILQDAFTHKGSHFGTTYNGLLPGARIDYIFYDEHFHAESFKTFKKNYSDHYPITVNLSTHTDGKE